MIKIILISGKAESGKDSTAILLKQSLEASGKKVLIVHYADYLKFICRQYYNWDGNKDEKGRHILQYIGTDVIRKRKPSFWVEIVIMLLSVLNLDYDFAIIPDCRFLDEISLMKKEYDTVAVNVVRLNYTNSLTPEQKIHPSETALDEFTFDYVLESEDGLDNLEKSVEKFIIAYNL
jgi:hypothetical protein